jgi:hypothetical protein
MGALSWNSRSLPPRLKPVVPLLSSAVVSYKILLKLMCFINYFLTAAMRISNLPQANSQLWLEAWGAINNVLYPGYL